MDDFKPLAGVYKWLGFITFWGALVWGLYEVVSWFVWAHYFIAANLPA